MKLKSKISLIFIFVIFLINSVSGLIQEYNLTYDPNGNLIQGFDKYFEYNSFNQLKLVRDDNSTGTIIVEYFYSPGGNRIKKVEYPINTTTYYIDENFIQIVNSSGIFNTTYYYDGEVLVGRKDSDGKKFFYHPDHLESTNIVTNNSGGIVEETTYLPYGEVMEGGDSRYLFTGKEKDTETGLYYYGTRYYDAYFKHFTQPDSNIKDIYNPQDLNRYVYARNNPYKYTDPSGNSPTLITGAIGLGVGASIGALVSIGTQYYTNGQVNWADVGKSAAVGGVAGGVAGLTLGLGNAAIGVAGLTGNAALSAEAGVATTSSIMGGQASRTGFNLIEGNSLTEGLGNPKDIAIDAGIGLATFGAGNYFHQTYLKTSWASSTYDDSLSSLDDHYIRHVLTSGTKMSKLQYTSEANSLYSSYLKGSLPENTKIRLDHPLRTGDFGIKITMPKPSKEMGIYTQNGKIVSYNPSKKIGNSIIGGKS